MTHLPKGFSEDQAVFAARDDTAITARGNAHGVTLKKAILEEAGLAPQDRVTVEARPGEIIIRKAGGTADLCREAVDDVFARYDWALGELAK